MKGINICKICAQGGKEATHFFCPADGLIHPENVNFLCNKCKTSEMVYRNGLYICPECLNNPNSFECRICGSPEVTLVQRGKTND